MSVNISLSFEMHNIEDFHFPEFDEEKRTAAVDVSNEFLEQEGLDKSEFIVDFLGKKGILAVYTPGVVNVPNTDKWLQDIEARWIALMHEKFGEHREAKVVVE